MLLYFVFFISFYIYHNSACIDYALEGNGIGAAQQYVIRSNR